MPTESRKRATAIVYSHPECGYCSLLTEDLAAKGVPYEEVDVSRAPSRWSEVEPLIILSYISPADIQIVLINPDPTSVFAAPARLELFLN